MELSGVLHVEVEVKSPAEKFWVALGDGINLFPKEFPKDYKTMQVLAGDGNSPGSIRLIIYGEGNLRSEEVRGYALTTTTKMERLEG
ncbi:hypothetical protein DY000_02023535 [Brassica cretica]|uniref:Bet v I/Major latex protein domain-containing protein n=1 Tax=Brassica cretica TaxID=69181 RepID=A0ABQ7EHZ0_BRACR|nr:hypothetical protein DY000_02023535 [Brassica cretica]